MKWTALLVLVACHGGDKQHASHTAMQTGTVTRGDLGVREVMTGELRAPSAVDFVAPRTEMWKIAIRWMVEDGAMVKAGDRVLEFDNSTVTADLEQKRLALLDAESTFRSAKDLEAIETANKQNLLEQHEVAYEKATLRADVPEDLLAKREIQERQLEKKRMEAEVKKARADVLSDRLASSLDLSVKQIELDKARHAIQVADQTIKQLTLVAPRDGVVLVQEHPWEGHQYHIGDSVQPGWAVVSMPDLAQEMEIYSELSDVDDGRIDAGEVGTCVLDAYPDDPISCTVAGITPVARIKGQNSLRRAFDVKLSLEKGKSKDRLRVGMSVKIVMVKAGAKAALLVPRGARLASSVKLGACDAQHCIVESGLHESDTVVIGGGE